jgi:hypothetical protein
MLANFRANQPDAAMENAEAALAAGGLNQRHALSGIPEELGAGPGFHARREAAE